MSQEPNPPQPSEVDYTTLKKQFADTLLAPDSPVANEAAFKRDRESYFDLLEQRKRIQEQIKPLQSETENVGEAERAAKEAESQLQIERKQLLELATTLGKTAFAGLQSGEIADDLRFKSRKDLESRIDALRRQKSSLASDNPAGVLEQASLKAQQLKLAGQIKAEEFRIKTVNRELGKAILSAKAEETVRCSDTEKVLEKINQQRKRISKAKEKYQRTELNYTDAQKQAAEQLGVDSVSTANSLQAELKQKESELRSIETRLEDIQDEVAEKALKYEWLRDNPALKEPLERFAQLKEESTPRKLYVWPLAAVVITGHLFSNLGSEPLNLSAFGVLFLYLATGLGGLGLLAYYKPDLVAGERRYKSLLLLFTYSIASIVVLFSFQSLAEHALANWTEAPDWSRNWFGLLVDLPRRLLVAVGNAYEDTFAIMFGQGEPESLVTYFQSHMFSVGLCEELIKLSPALIAFAAYTGSWRSRSQEFNSRLVYLAMIGGLAFGLGEAVYYHFRMYAPMQLSWGVYAVRFLSLVTIHAVWAGISGWILAHVTGGWIRSAFTTIAHGLGPVVGCLLIVATVGVSDVLHTSHNISNDPLWILTWDVISLALFAWLIRCSNVSQLVPEQARRLWRRGFSTAEVVAVAARLKNLAVRSSTSTEESTVVKTTEELDGTNGDVSSEPALWNPNAAGFWSLLLTPVFGAWLHAKNWASLNETEKSKRSFHWVYGSIVVGALSFILPEEISKLVCGALLIAWWIVAGNEQYKFVNENYPDYQKKKWGIPLTIAGSVIFGLTLVSTAFVIDNSSKVEMRKLVGRWSTKIQINEVDDESGVEYQGELDGTMTYSADATSSYQGDMKMVYVAPNGERARLVLSLEAEGTWSFDGTTLREFTSSISVVPGNSATQQLAKNDPQTFSETKRELEQLEERSYGSVIFLNDNEVELLDHETGITLKLKRLHERSE
jgi:RsiW-degrading membrane proteinase PrsW (M82 family)/phosphopantetheine adenylyltransferase